MKIESLLIHGGVDGDEVTGAVNIPIYQTSTYKQPSFGVNSGYEYSRTGNPTREAVEKLISDLEGGIGGVAFASGMAATTAVFSMFKSGDKIIISDNLYGGTFRVLDKIFSNFNIKYKIVDTSDIEKVNDVIIKSKIDDDDIKAIFIETPTNPLMDITDIKAVSKLAKDNGILTIVDNTFMTPYLQKPLALGADIVIHSATKYLSGHSDLVAGLVVVKDKEIYNKVKFIQNATGGVLGPFDSFLLLRGIKTLGVRMDRHIDNSLKIAELLRESKYVDKVFYPGLKDHVGYKLQKEQASGPGGVISFILNKKIEYKKFLSSLDIITFGESLGGVESLICHPASMTHGSIPFEIRQQVGIVDNLIRLSVGIENFEDIVEDIEKGFKEALLNG